MQRSDKAPFQFDVQFYAAVEGSIDEQFEVRSDTQQISVAVRGSMLKEASIC